MPEWIDEVSGVIQLVLNTVVVVGGAAIWKLYVDKLRATVESKNATIESVEKSRDLWKEKAEGLESRSPEVVEKSLAERIRIRDDEISRLTADKEFDATAVRELEVKKSELERDLFRAQGFRAMLAMEEGTELEEEKGFGAGGDADGTARHVVDGPREITVELIGEVGVDSGQLMVTDPCYVDTEWQDEPFIPDGKIERDEDTLFHYSYDGACRSTLSGGGHGELAFTKGHAGAGVVFSTAWGDGMYAIYAEKHDGHIVRVYVNVG
ncbi:DUF4241 domain-containing protein [Rathayibacter sp. ZW T2_19]|uniref:DUF4241 domain-containing protein n=1 Tax=Rathayibacter rubneri TaxID=2950106 RepID=A0A9X2DVJ3_9MICO|nr:DUF4241 domain-containing protein [Rathayibacter rubneri]MCM6761910.1 DUF4241 domain-containing protein [Rathayibacter rubneri]